jgi:hypothetical protein
LLLFRAKKKHKTRFLPETDTNQFEPSRGFDVGLRHGSANCKYNNKQLFLFLDSLEEKMLEEPFIKEEKPETAGVNVLYQEEEVETIKQEKTNGSEQTKIVLSQDPLSSKWQVAI